MKPAKKTYRVTVSMILSYTIEASNSDIAEAIAETIARFQAADESKIASVAAKASEVKGE